MAHIFLSYQHQQQEIVMKIQQELKSRGYKTWFDEDDMAGSVLDGMAEAVEKAAVVIMCMSASYRKSDNCKIEIGYAEREKTPIIPIRVEAGYKPRGWVGIISESKRVVDFSDPEKFNDKFRALLKELKAKEIEPSEVAEESDDDIEGDEDNDEYEYTEREEDEEEDEDGEEDG